MLRLADLHVFHVQHPIVHCAVLDDVVLQQPAASKTTILSRNSRESRLRPSGMHHERYTRCTYLRHDTTCTAWDSVSRARRASLRAPGRPQTEVRKSPHTHTHARTRTHTHTHTHTHAHTHTHTQTHAHTHTITHTHAHTHTRTHTHTHTHTRKHTHTHTHAHTRNQTTKHATSRASESRLPRRARASHRCVSESRRPDTTLRRRKQVPSQSNRSHARLHPRANRCRTEGRPRPEYPEHPATPPIADECASRLAEEWSRLYQTSRCGRAAYSHRCRRGGGGEGGERGRGGKGVGGGGGGGTMQRAPPGAARRRLRARTTTARTPATSGRSTQAVSARACACARAQGACAYACVCVCKWGTVRLRCVRACVCDCKDERLSPLLSHLPVRNHARSQFRRIGGRYPRPEHDRADRRLERRIAHADAVEQRRDRSCTAPHRAQCAEEEEEGAAVGLTPPTSAPGLGSPRPHLRRDWARPRHNRGRGVAAKRARGGRRRL
jgi:hypothetical protein